MWNTDQEACLFSFMVLELFVDNILGFFCCLSRRKIFSRDRGQFRVFRSPRHPELLGKDKQIFFILFIFFSGKAVIMTYQIKGDRHKDRDTISW